MGYEENCRGLGSNFEVLYGDLSWYAISFKNWRDGEVEQVVSESITQIDTITAEKKVTFGTDQGVMI